MENKIRVFYSAPVKAVVLVLCALGIFLTGFCGILLADLSARGVPIGQAKTSYENTEACGIRVRESLNELKRYYTLRSQLHIGQESWDKTVVDITEFGNGAIGEAGENTSYTLSQLKEMCDQICALGDDYVLEAAEQYSTDDAGVRLYSDDYSSEEYVDIYQKAKEDQQSYMDEQSGIIVDPEGNVRQSQGEHFFPSQTTIQMLAEKGFDYRSYSSQFLYLYETGGQYETDMPESGVSIRDYAAAHPELSLYDLYSALYEAADTFKEYQSEDAAQGEESNLWYCVETEDGSVFSNVDEWKKGFETAYAAVSMPDTKGEGRKNRFAGVAYVREEGRADFETKTSSSDMIQMISSWIAANHLVSDSEKAVVALNTTWPAEDEFFQASSIFRAWGRWTPLLAGLMAFGAVLSLVTFVLITMQAGRKSVGREIQLYSFDRMPTEVYAIVIFLAGLLIICLPVLVVGLSFQNYPVSYEGNNQYYYRNMQAYRSLFSGLSLSGGVMLMMPLYSSLVRRVKAGNLWRRSLVYSIFKMCHEVYDARKLSQKILIIFIGYAALQILFLWGFGGFGLILAVLLDVIAVLYLVREAAGRQTIQAGLRRIGSGDLEYKIDLTTLRGDNLEMAETVNSVGKGLQAAIQEQMKSERLKADLITNVSHDIKTPLTSIINYVDLIKREEIADPKIRGYIDILDAKSQRLKQLTEDLVEASKISSGNIRLEFMNLNLNELVQQVNGEFDERFAERNLSLVCTLGNEPLVIRADSRRIWRVLENLYVNVVKYAMPGTRVYVEAGKRNDRIVFSIKNISENALNINADELTERFIRGDVSRSTEGSGLGLSIAKNLTTLQHGTFRIYLDGDLFKVTITFDEVRENRRNNEAENPYRAPGRTPDEAGTDSARRNDGPMEENFKNGKV